MASETQLLKRADVPRELTWNAESVYPDREAWQAALQEAFAAIPDIQALQGTLAQSPEALKKVIDATEKAMGRAIKLYVYAAVTQACNVTDEGANAMVGQVTGLYGMTLAATAFVDPELLALGHDTLWQWMHDHADLAPYAHYIDNLFRRQQHVRSAEVESLLGALGDVFGGPSNTYEMLTSSEIPFADAVSADGEKHKLTQGTLGRLLNEPDRELRRTAWQHMADGHLAVKNTLASNYTTAVKQAVFNARARSYPSALEASLFENNIPVSVFRNLIDTFQKNLPTWHRYWAIRRRALGVETLHPWDIWAPIAKQQPVVSYQQGVEWVAEGMAPLGEEYVSALRRGCLEERWVDVLPNVGKTQGAFSSGMYETYPFIMLNWNDNLFAVSTLAHELGHSMHSYLTWKHQPPIYSNYSLFVAEVASNFNQALVRSHLMQTNDDPQFQIAVIEEAMYNFHRYFFIMPTLARFELEMHERVERGDALTAEGMNQRLLELYQEGYGVELDPDGERTGITWAQFGHFYSNFYVYQYATGISAANALADRILTGDTQARDHYLKFLSLGSSVYPIDALKVAGVDMSTPDVVETAFGVLARYVDRLGQLVG